MSFDGIISICALITTICSAIFVAYQAYLYNKDYKTRNSDSEIEKAIQLSRYYKEEILSNMGYLVSVFRAAGVEEIIKKIDYNKFKKFNNQELNKLLTKKEIMSIEEKINNINVDILINLRSLLRGTTNDEIVESNILSITNHVLKTMEESAAGKIEEESNSFSTSKTKAKIVYKIKSELYRRELKDVIYNTLNNMEYFSMHFNYKVADEEVIYQSLHQSYLSLVKMLYFYIASQNELPKDKYFTNVIKLYNSWVKRYKLKCEEEDESEDEIIHNGKPKKK